MGYTVITVVNVSVRILSVKSLIPAFAVEVIEVFIVGIQWVVDCSNIWIQLEALWCNRREAMFEGVKYTVL